MMDYGLILISHATDKVFKDEAGNEYNKIVPTLDKRANNIVARMADIIGYSRIVTDKDGNNLTKLFMRGTPRYEAGSRFKYTPDYIDFSYDNLVSAISEAIDKQSQEDGKEFFTDKKNIRFFDFNDAGQATNIICEYTENPQPFIEQREVAFNEVREKYTKEKFLSKVFVYEA